MLKISGDLDWPGSENFNPPHMRGGVAEALMHGIEKPKSGRYASLIIPGMGGTFATLNHYTKESHPWRFPGGKIEPGEPPIAAAARELKEELGVNALGLIYSSTQTHTADGGTWTGEFFLVTAYDGILTIQEPEKMSNLSWFTPKELLERDSHPEYEVVMKHLYPGVRR